MARYRNVDILAEELEFFRIRIMFRASMRQNSYFKPKAYVSNVT
jgi:hypothetical protein